MCFFFVCKNCVDHCIILQSMTVTRTAFFCVLFWKESTEVQKNEKCQCVLWFQKKRCSRFHWQFWLLYFFWCFSSNPKRCFKSNSRLMVEYSTKFALENILIFSAGKILLLWYENPVPFANFMYLGKLILCGNLLEKKFFFFLKHQVV